MQKKLKSSVLCVFRGIRFWSELLISDTYRHTRNHYQTECRVQVDKLILSDKTVCYFKWFYLCSFWWGWVWWGCYSEETAINCVKLQRVEMRLHLWINNLPLFQSFLNMLLYLYMNLHSWKTYKSSSGSFQSITNMLMNILQISPWWLTSIDYEVFYVSIMCADDDLYVIGCLAI